MSTTPQQLSPKDAVIGKGCMILVGAVALVFCCAVAVKCIDDTSGHRSTPTNYSNPTFFTAAETQGYAAGQALGRLHRKGGQEQMPLEQKNRIAEASAKNHGVFANIDLFKRRFNEGYNAGHYCPVKGR